MEQDFPQPSRLALGPTKPRVRWTPSRLQRSIGHSPTTSVEGKERVYTSTHPGGHHGLLYVSKNKKLTKHILNNPENVKKWRAFLMLTTSETLKSSNICIVPLLGKPSDKSRYFSVVACDVTFSLADSTSWCTSKNLQGSFKRTCSVNIHIVT